MSTDPDISFPMIFLYYSYVHYLLHFCASTGAFVGTTMEKRVDAVLLPTKPGRGMSFKLKTFWTFLARYWAHVSVNPVNVVFFSHLPTADQKAGQDGSVGTP